MMSKRSFFLLEILVVLCLITIVFSVLFISMGKGLKVEKKRDALRQEFLRRGWIHSRLQDLFISIDLTKQFALDLKKEHQSFTKRLLFYANGGIDPDPLFNGSLPVTLHLDQNHDLVLSKYSQLISGKKRKCRQEILASQIDQWIVEFFDEKGNWVTAWPKEKKTAPTMLRLTITHQQIPIAFAFQIQ